MASYQQISTLPRPPVAPTADGAGPSQPADVFTVRIPRDKKRKFTIMKFGTSSTVDFTKVGEQPVKMERENNLKEYRTANDLDTMPKFGAGSEYGRDMKEESRRKKYGIMLKRYNPNDQPWHLKIGAGKQAKRYKGVREGTISENTSYFIFTKALDGAFEAFPVEEWYNFSPIIKYKYLNSDEAEEEFSRRDKTLNYFSIMVKKRLKKEEDLVDEEEELAALKGLKKSKGKNKKDLVLTDMDEWDDLKMSDDDDDDDNDADDDDGGGASKKKKAKKSSGRRVKNSKRNSDDEAIEESDEGDFDDREVDYMSDSGSDDSLSAPEDEDKGKSKYDEKGVDQEDGLRNILDSDAEDEQQEEEEEQKEEEEPEEEKPEGKKEKKKGEDNSSSSSSDDDSDIEKDAKLASDIFLQPRQNKEQGGSEATPFTSAAAESGSPDKTKDKAIKRKAEKSVDGKQPSAKKHKSESTEGISEDAIRRYLMRKPMTTKDLLTKFKAKKLNMTNERMTHVIAQILKRINPEKQIINKVLYLSLKKPE